MSVTAERFLNSLHYTKKVRWGTDIMAPNAVLSRSSVGAPQTRFAAAWQATSRGRPRRRCTERRIAQVSIRMSSRIGMALRKAPAPSWLTATKRTASRQASCFARSLPLACALPFLPRGADRDPAEPSAASSSARSRQFLLWTTVVKRRCAWCSPYRYKYRGRYHLTNQSSVLSRQTNVSFFVKFFLFCQTLLRW